MQGTNKLQIKGMVCTRCITILFDELSLIGLEVISIKLGEVFFKGELPEGTSEDQIQSILHKYGFELLSDKKLQLVSQIKERVKKAIDLQTENRTITKFSEYLNAELRKDYAYLSSVFSDYEGITLEKFIIQQRINKVKEQLIQTDKSLTEISDELGYSSVSHLSRQLKTYTGFDTYYYKNLRKNTLLSADVPMA